MPSLNPAKYIRFAARIGRYGWPIRHRTNLSLVAQAREVYQLLRRNGLEPEEYYRYELYDPNRTWEAKTSYLSRVQQVRLERAMNPPNDEGVLNKLVFKIYARHFDLPVPEMYGLFAANLGFTFDGAELRTRDQLRSFIADLPADRFLFKPITGNHGDGIHICRRLPGGLIDIAGLGELSCDDLHDRMGQSHFGRYGAAVADSYLCEAHVQQHPFFDNYARSCTQTCRIVLFTTRSGKMQLVAALLKLGTEGKFVDNVGESGLAARIYDDGRLGIGVRQTRDGLRYFDKHPETGFPITNQHIPGFPEALAAACKAQAAIPQLRLLGWDIAITERGPMILEGNNYWAWEMMQRGTDHGLIHGELEKELRVLMGQR